jgi:tRNA-modifying protein YgfZ
VIAALSQFAIVRVSGADAKSFLSNQLTNDIDLVDDNTAQYSAWCTHKGRVVASFIVCLYDDDYLLLVDREMAPDVIGRMEMYILNSQVSLSLDDNMVAMGLYGPDAESFLDKADIKYPSEIYSALMHNKTRILRTFGLAPRFLFIGDWRDMMPIWDSLNVNCAQIGANAWSLISIRAGIPNITTSTSELFTPHMLNMPDIPMVSFTKGCYPGQEVVARTQYLGKSKRKMYHITINTSDLPEPGAELVHSGGKSAGTVVQVSLNGDDKVEALAVLNQAAIDANNITDTDGNGVNFIEIAYK